MERASGGFFEDRAPTVATDLDRHRDLAVHRNLERVSVRGDFFLGRHQPITAALVALRPGNRTSTLTILKAAPC